MMPPSPLLAAAKHLKDEVKGINPKLAFVGTALTVTIIGYMLFKDMKHTAQELMRELKDQKGEPEAENTHGHRHHRTRHGHER